MILHPIIDLLKRIVIALPDYGGGSSIENGLEYTIENDVIKKAKYIGEVMPTNILKYCWYDYGTGIIIDLSNVTTLKDGCFSGCNRIIIDFSTCSNITLIGSNSFSFSGSSQSNMSDQNAVFPKLTGVNSGEQIFRGMNQYFPANWSFPIMTSIPKYFFAYTTKTNLNIEFGSIGNIVSYCNSLPFGSAPNASGTVTVYTNGEYLDDVKNAIQNGASSSLQFVYKAGENTTYNGSAYNAGDTILTV